jgi:murein DD-endopeptidase MepM/ murein hydrolase activator NlpD
MPPAQAQNWELLVRALDEFLARSPQETSSLDIVRSYGSTEAELALDARMYGGVNEVLAEDVMSRLTRLGVRMAEVRRLGVKTREVRSRFSWPVEPVAVSSLFGRRLHPISGTYQQHMGVDLAARVGQLVTASADGVVSLAAWNGGHGFQVELRHSQGVTTRYSHLSQLLVESGARVARGDPIGLAGSTGRSTGPHLHFELWREGRPKDPLNELGAPLGAGPWASR